MEVYGAGGLGKAQELFSKAPPPGEPVSGRAGTSYEIAVGASGPSGDGPSGLGTLEKYTKRENRHQRDRYTRGTKNVEVYGAGGLGKAQQLYSNAPPDWVP